MTPAASAAATIAVRIIDGRGERLLDEDVFAGGRRGDGDRAMRVIGRRDRNSVHRGIVENARQIRGPAPRAVGLREWRARELVEIADRHEVGRGMTLIGLSVALAEETGPDEGKTTLHDHADTDVFQKKGHTAGVRP